MKPATVAGQKAKYYCEESNISLPMRGLSTWDDRNGFKAIQEDLPAYDSVIDGLFYSKSVAAFVKKYQHHLIVDDELIAAPGIELVNFLNRNCHRFKARRRIEIMELHRIRSIRHRSHN